MIEKAQVWVQIDMGSVVWWDSEKGLIPSSPGTEFPCFYNIVTVHQHNGICGTKGKPSQKIE